MICPNCGHPVNDGEKYCTNCGAAVTGGYESVRPVTSAAALPPQNRPLSPWAYFGYQLLFSIPLVGFVCLIIFSFSDENINRRNFARSYWCALLIGLVLFAVMIALAIAFGVTEQVSQAIEEGMANYSL